MLLTPDKRTKIDDGDDQLFYAYPRFVTHIDDLFIKQLTSLYREILQPNFRIFDLMSSWVSHLPEEIEYAHVEGHGLNAEELAKNPRFNHYFVQNLNQNPKLPFNDREFDAVLNTVSVQYLQYPETVFSEIHRILKPNGVAVVSFSNRMFYQKAIAAWRDGSDMERVGLVQNYFRSVAGFCAPEVLSRQSQSNSWFSLLTPNSDPFYAVIARRDVDKDE